MAISYRAISYRINLILRQFMDFGTKTLTPVPLALDLLKLKRTPYVARLADGYQLHIRPGTGERFAFFENAIRHDYLKHGAQLLPGDIVIDVGANIGAFAVLASKLVGPTGRVIAVEPSTETFEQLKLNIALNNATNVTPVHAALAAFNGTIQLNVSAISIFSSIYDKVGGHVVAGTTQNVRALTLGTLLEENQIAEVAMVKIDCEGAEYDLFDSLPLDVSSRMTQICMEIHPVPGRETGEIYQLLNHHGFRVHADTDPVFADRPPSA